MAMLRASLERLLAGMAAGTVAAFSGATVLAAQPATSLGWTLQGLLLGGAAGLVSPVLRRRKPEPSPEPESPSRWRTLVVSQKQIESEEITSFVLRSADGAALPRFLPGQFLTLELNIPGQSRAVLRTYSLSDYPLGPDEPDRYRVSIKREPAPQGQDVPPGLASNFLHDHVQVGSPLQVRPPPARLCSTPTAPIPSCWSAMESASRQ